MSFQQGLSGLNAAAKNLDAIGNNVANANTVGFKQSQAQFADVFAKSLSGGGASQVGIGVKVSQMSQQFTQGNISTTNNALDLAINGSGFFRMDTNGEATFQRNGQFQLNAQGFIVNATGSRLTGYTANSAGVLSTGAPAALSISTADLSPQATTAVSAVLNLDSRNTAPAVAFDMNDPLSFNNSSAVSVYDSLGNSHTLQTFYVKTGANAWNVYASLDGTPIGYTPPAAAVPVGSFTFDATGALTGAGGPPAVAGATTITIPPQTLSTGASPLGFPMDFVGTTQFGSNFSVNALQQDGFTSGRLGGFNISADGIILGRYTNGQSAVLGQVVLANFANPNGLQQLGNNQWAESAASGAPLLGAPDTGNLGVLQSSAVEDSNVDLTAELVNMITAQRVYQANAQTIKTQDAVLQTLVNLR